MGMLFASNEQRVVDVGSSPTFPTKTELDQPDGESVLGVYKQGTAWSRLAPDKTGFEWLTSHKINKEVNKIEYGCKHSSLAFTYVESCDNW